MARRGGASRPARPTQAGPGSSARSADAGPRRFLRVFAVLPRTNPLLGAFAHAPSAGNRSAAFFATELIYEAELLERKKLRQNPVAGTFHALPGYYNPLHGLKRFREQLDEHKQRAKRWRRADSHRAPARVAGWSPCELPACVAG